MYNPQFTRVVERLPAPVMALLTRQPLLQLSLKIGLLLVMFMAVEFFVQKASILPANSYHHPSLVLELGQRMGVAGLSALVMLSLLLARFGSLLSPWQALEHGQRIRYLVIFLAGLIAWPLTTYGYNFYFDQGHNLDRALLLLLWLGLWWRPAFIYPFLLLAFTLLWQFKEPTLGGTILAHKLQVLHVLNLFAAAFGIHAISGYRKTDSFVFLSCCLVAAAYWLPAYAKLQIDWLSHGHLYRLPMAAYAHGWLAFLDPQQIVTFAKSIAWLDWPMRIAVILVEAGCLLFLWRRSLSITLLIGVIIFHLGVFALYGFLFWTWILLDVALLVLLWRDLKNQHWLIYTREHLIISVVLIGLCSLWVKTPALAWLDTRLSYTYKIDAITDNGDKFTLSPTFFAPYDDVFTMASFSYLNRDHQVLVGPYAVTANTKIADALNIATTPQQIFALEQDVRQQGHGGWGYHQQRAAGFYEFIRRFVANHNARASARASASKNSDLSWLNLSWLSPPRQFWSQYGEQPTTDNSPIRQIIVREVTSLYDEHNLQIIRDHTLARITIPHARELPGLRE